MKRNTQRKFDETDRIDKRKEMVSLVEPYTDQKQRQSFQDSLEEETVSGFVLNSRIKGIEKEIESLSSCERDKSDSLLFRYKKKDCPLGKSVLHFGGAFYILDPSSAYLTFALAPLLKKNAIGLDMCAAPGGKSISLSSRRKDILLLSNDISFARAEEMKKNVDRLGLTNIVTSSLDPLKINLRECFDYIILDAPCSGSGMFRKEEKMLDDFTQEKVTRLLPTQESLLEKAYSLLKKDGILAYSTCSLSVEEDEEQVKKFQKKHSDIELIKIKADRSILSGVNGIGFHMVPGIFAGEGFYFCLMKKTGGNEYQFNEIKNEDGSLYDFIYQKNEFLIDRMEKEFLSLRLVSPGLQKNDSSPHPKCEYDHAYSKIATDIPLLELTKEEAIQYAKGNEVNHLGEGKEGLVILTYHSLRLGFGKKVSARIKNYLPKGLRMDLV